MLKKALFNFENVVVLSYSAKKVNVSLESELCSCCCVLLEQAVFKN